jgi:uncharacterized NAD(P)/FAD-binding protein YdhS
VSGRRVAVVGAGASGTIQALHLIRAGAGKVMLIERARIPGRGVAYGTRRPEHLLNVPARRMSVWPDDPDDFAHWLAARGGEPYDFARREQFGDYLAGLRAREPAIEIVVGEAVAIEDGAEQTVRLRDGRALLADAVVLAPGNLPPRVPAGLDPARLGAAFVGDPWQAGFAQGLGDEDNVLLIGTGLTAVDAALTLDALGFRGRILALSRRGLLPRASLAHDPATGDFDPPDGGPAALLRGVRARAREVGWHGAVQETRRHAQRLWEAAPPEGRHRFLRHLRPWWDVHRHRIAPAVADRIEAMRREGRLEAAAGRILSAEEAGDGAAVRWRPRGAKETRLLKVRRIVNCTGPELDIRHAGQPLFDALLASGRIRPDPCRLGIEVDALSRAVDVRGAPSDSLAAIGPVTRGAFWESVAVSDIAVQAQRVAARLAK